jgi:rare lipoprotein A
MMFIILRRCAPSGALLGLSALLLATLTGCSFQPLQLPGDAAAREAIINPPRGRLGNPPVYEVHGKRYYVLETSVGYRERGMASWYGRDFHGRSTAGGERYDMYALTAAHTTLPIPTWVEVTHLGNGRRVIVKINDRGPFVDGRLVDLSYAAAEALGMVSAGTAYVEVRVLGEPAGSTRFGVGTAEPAEVASRGFSIISDADAATPDDDDRPMQRIYAQIGAFSQRDNALKLVGTLEAGGYDAVFVVSESSSDGDWHRVRIGPLADLNAYDDVVERLSSLGLNESRLIVER